MSSIRRFHSFIQRLGHLLNIEGDPHEASHRGSLRLNFMALLRRAKETADFFT